MEPPPLISRKRHFFYVLVFSISAFLFTAILIGTIFPVMIELWPCEKCPAYQGNHHNVSLNITFLIGLLLSLPFSFVFNRFMIVANAKPDDNEVPLSKLAGYGKQIFGWKGIALLSLMLLVYFALEAYFPSGRVQRNEMSCALHRGDIEDSRECIMKGYDVTWGFEAALILGREEIAKLYYRNGADKDGSGFFDDAPIILAIQHRCLEIAETLIKDGADISFIGRNGRTALIESINHGDHKLSKMLIKHGADINAIGKNGASALFLSIRNHGYDNITELLIRKGAKIRFPRIQIHQPILNHTIYYGDAKIVELLLAEGVKINTREVYGGKSNPPNWLGDTPLHMAIRDKRFDIAKMLIEAGCDVNMLTYDNKLHVSALDLAAKDNLIEFVELLRSHGAKTGEELKASSVKSQGSGVDKE